MLRLKVAMEAYTEHDDAYADESGAERLAEVAECLSGRA
jgi:hypothetical protein